MTKIAIFASGRGSNFRAIQAEIENGSIPGRISVLVVDKETAGAIDFAGAKDIPFQVVVPKLFPSSEAFGDRLLQILAEHEIDIIVLAGYLKKIPDNVVRRFTNRIVNIHPSLLPAFGGKGMYGMRVHQAAFQRGVKISGVTIHLVNSEYDEGPILLQKAVDVSGCPDPEEIARTVLAEEHRLLPLAVKMMAENKIRVVNNRVMIEDFE